MSYRVIQPKAVNINCDKHACRMCPFVGRSASDSATWQCNLFDVELSSTPAGMPRRCTTCKLAEVKE
jgi:hypothetical protein